MDSTLEKDHGFVGPAELPQQEPEVVKCLCECSIDRQGGPIGPLSFLKVCLKLMSEAQIQQSTDVPGLLVDDMKALLESLEAPSGFATGLSELISQSEIEALKERLGGLIAEPLIPVLDSRWNVPWPLV